VIVKTLHLLRHAKSDWSGAVPDHERPLNKRGKRARGEVASYVSGWSVDLVVCSTARRARATAKPVVAALECEECLDDALYTAHGPEDLLTVIRSFSDELESVMVVGHNPWIEELTAVLCGAGPAYPTAALGTVELDVVGWADVAPGSGTLVAHVTPAELGSR
jgi:phosphohistidine phosphatase